MASGESAAQGGGLRCIPFTVEAEQQIKSLSFWLSIVGGLSIAAGVLDLISIITARNLGHIFIAILHVVVGVWALRAATAFKKVAVTDVADQAFLVEGLSKLRGIFWLQGLLILVGLAFVAAVLLFALFQGLSVG